MRRPLTLYWVLAAALALLGSLPALAQQPAAADTARYTGLFPEATDTTRYQPATDERRVGSLTDSAGVCTELLRWGPRQGLLRSFYASGTLRSYVPLADVDQGLRHGNVSSWYENGQLSVLELFVSGVRQGTMLLYYEDGHLKRQTDYEAGAELPGLCYDPVGQPIPYFPYEQSPLYPGGVKQLMRELNKLVSWQPAPRSLAALVPSFLQITFLVGENGRVSEPRIEAGSLLPDYDQAIVAALGRLSRAWVPGLRDGQPAAYRYWLRLTLSQGPVEATLWHL